MRSLAADLTRAEESERKMIAADIHDYVNQYLAIAQFKLEELEAGHFHSSIKVQLQKIRELIISAIRGARNLSFELCPPILHECGLGAAVGWMAKRFQDDWGIKIRFENENRSARPGADIEALLFKSLREMLCNVRKHSHAQNVCISIWNDQSNIYITVEDDGCGFDLSKQAHSHTPEGGFGLYSIRERLRYIGGECEIRSVISQGTRCTLRAPLEKCS